MSIAAGIRYRNGVLLCADTEQSAWTHTLHESKIQRIRLPEAEVVIAYAGHTDFSLSAIEKCGQVLRRTESEALLEELEGTLEEEYRRHVLSHPGYATDGSLAYRMLIAFWRSGEKARLFVTTQTAMREVLGYECIGSGDYLAHYLMRPNFTSALDERTALALSAIALAGVKGYVEGVGGVSCFMAVRDNGSVGDAFSLPAPGMTPRTAVEWIDNSSKGYRYLFGKLLITAANPELSDANFMAYLSTFSQQIAETRERWMREADRESMIFINREGSPDPRPTRAGQLRPQPSPELPEGSDES